MLTLNLISFSTCFNNTHHLPAHSTVPDLTATLFFPFPIQRTHSTAINEPNWIVKLNKPDDFFTNMPKTPNDNKKKKKSPQTGISQN